MTKSNFLIALFSLLATTNLAAQNNLPPVYEIKTDDSDHLTLAGNFLQILEDPLGKWTVDEVSQSPLSDKFHSTVANAGGIDRSVRTYWIRYRFRNDMAHEVKMALPKEIGYADLFVRGADGKWSHQTTGTVVPWSKRDGLKRIVTVMYTLQPGAELLIYERDQKVNFIDSESDLFIDKPFIQKIDFGFTDKLIERNYTHDDSSISVPFFLSGFLLLAALFNLYFFLAVREPVYLYFSLVLLFRGIGGFLLKTDIFFKELPNIKWYVVGTSFYLFFFFWIHFVRYYLETYKYMPRWDKFLTGLSIYLVVYGTARATGIIFVGEPGVAVVMFFILVTFILFMGSGKNALKWRILASLPPICILSLSFFTYLFELLNKFTGIPMPALTTMSDNNFGLLEEIGLVWLLIFFSWSLFERYQQLQKKIAQEDLTKERLAKEREIERNELIAKQKLELEKQVIERTSELKQSLEDLKSAQSQLIQSEKMASLGELTAGIAHEIQNPLNFVNNFSEVNKELIEELRDGKSNPGAQDEILKDIDQNLDKIIQHGKRADAIVKGMLQHSRISQGQKEPVDINALAGEYLRLSYHGLRAKDKSFNTSFETDFDTNLDRINIVSQDMGRVFVNLLNNAFYSVNEKKKKLDEAYAPLVTVSTKKLHDHVEIRVTDNGLGIPQKNLKKIFQPFFTTKPTGQGTGLGLSLAYDIIKAHGGEIRVESREMEFTEFVVELPLAKILVVS